MFHNIREYNGIHSRFYIVFFLGVLAYSVYWQINMTIIYIESYGNSATL